MFQVDEGSAFDRVFDREWDSFLADEFGPRGERAVLWRRALRLPGALTLIRDLGRRLSSFSFPDDLIASEPVGGRSMELLTAGVRATLDAVVEIQGRVTGLAPTMTRFLPSSSALLSAFLDGGTSAMTTAAAPFPLGEFVRRQVPVAGKKVAGESEETVRAVAGRAHVLIKALARVDEESVDTLLRAALPLAKRCRETLLRDGFVSFDALLRLTRDLLARHPEVRRALGSRHRALLIDEFQDTDPLQYEIVFFIAESAGPPVDDAYRAGLEPGRLFIVGDPKQSIYRFRGADIEAYGRAVDRVLACGGEALRLEASFRSPQEVVEPVNALFAGWIGPDTPDEAVFEPHYDAISSARGPIGDGRPRVEVWSVEAAGNAPDRRRGEAAAIAGWITDHHGRPDATGTSLAYRDVALLMRALTHAGLYAQALRRAGIPFIVEGGKDFYERPEVGDLIAFLRAAAAPGDAASVLAVMRSPLGAVPDTELARFAAAGGRLDDAGGGPADTAPFANIARTFARLEVFRAAMPGRPPDDIIRAALRDTPLALLHASTYEGPQRLANLHKLAGRAESLARQGLSLEETLRAIEDELRGERSEGESPLADETVDAVRILSVHKAKGLEFPVVIVPDLGRESRGPGGAETSVARVADDGAGVLAVRLASGTTNAAWVRHHDLNRRHEIAEEKRVFYVACTRAMERLILVNSNSGGAAPWRDALQALGYSCENAFPPDGLAGHRLVKYRRLVPGEAVRAAPVDAAHSRWSEAAAAFAEVAASARATAAPPVRRATGTPEPPSATPGLTAEDAGDAPWRAGRERSTGLRDTALLAGSAVHAALEAWDFEDPGRLRRLAQTEARRIAAPSPVDPDRSEAPEVEREVGAILDRFLRSPLPARLAGEEILGREVPVLYRDGEGVTRIGVCDLVYRDRYGRIIAADYKTGRVEGDARLAAERYAPQVQVYVEALRRALPGETVCGEVLFLRGGTAVAIEPDDLTRPAARGGPPPDVPGRRPSRKA